MNKWQMPTKVYEVNDFNGFFSEIKNKKIFLVVDPFLKNSSRFIQWMNEISSRNQVAAYSDIVPDPTISVVTAGYVKMNDFNPDLVIAIGGGSAIDSAKAILYLDFKINKKRIETFYAVPTTSGTGSEVTSACVITDPQTQIKYPIFSKELYPDVAVLSIEWVLSCPPKVTAYSGLDVLTHALEALVAKNASEFSDSLAKSAIKLVFENLEKCYFDGTNEFARKKMHEASCMAGIAFDNAGLGLSHALAHQLGGQFHIPHGLANGMLLPYIIDFSQKDTTAKEKYAQLAVELNLGSSFVGKSILVRDLKKAILHLTKTLECPMSLEEYGVTSEERNKYNRRLVENARKDITYQSAPIQASEEELLTILNKI